MSGALDGISVLDLSQGAAGPLCATLLGDLGADVVKVEPPGGEWGRQLGPPFLNGVAAAFIGLNRNKRSIIVDLKQAGAAAIVLRLAASSDIVVESFRPGVADRMGIGYEAVRPGNPGLIYAAISAFGREGPWRDRPGVDGVVQAMSGIMAVTGSDGGPPVKVGVPAADMCGGTFAYAAVLAALLSRERTGKGQRVDVSLLDAMLTFQVVPLTMYLAAGEPPARMGSAAPYAAPNEAFPTADGHIQIAAYTPKRWVSLCETLDRPELAHDHRFDTNSKRVQGRDQLHAVLDPVFAERSTAEWMKVFDEADLICGPLIDYPELVASEQVRGGGSLITVEHPAIGAVRTIGGPIRFSETLTGIRRSPPPIPGEHTIEVLVERGFHEDQIADLLSRRIVGAAEDTRQRRNP
ncbi:MAG TPA: CoA transferase [Acidimicrobiia bacterium]|nr:CoA transferase [Acidimicrobiia bacterium]